MKPFLEVAQVFRAFGPAYREDHGPAIPLRHKRVMGAIESCRTAELGCHVDQCDQCGALRISYNSCRNRHCPKCQSLDKERWLQAREEEVLPTSYFHAVFTLPEGVRPLALRNQKVVYHLLFQSASETLTRLAKDPKHLGAEIGLIAMLHTWTQTLMDHPHLHCLIPGGGLSPDGKQWVPSREDFFLPVKVVSVLFRGKFLDGLKKAYAAGELTFAGQIEGLKDPSAFKRLLQDLYEQDWEVYCKPTLRNPEKLMDYLGRYTHRVALSNDRLVKIEGSQVTFRWRDSADQNKIKLLTLEAFEFIRRFLLHVLPDQFVKIRYYGILSHRNRKGKLLRCRRLLGVRMEKESKKAPRETWEDLLTRITGVDPRVCPHCGKGKMIRKEIVAPCSVRGADRALPQGERPP